MTFPREERPDVSVVVATKDAWALTRQALQAVATHTDRPYEVVVVDNGSADETLVGLAEFDNVTVIRNRENHGFGPACNQGAAVARARHLLFLNSDAVVHRGWLDPLVDVADSDAAVAAVAPRLVHSDGRLQEAGSILWREGRVLNYGDGDRPDAPEYGFRRDVEYASAACLLVRRSAFIDVGGFDPVFAPAYFEDADLCLELRKMGGRIVYQPRSVVTHVRWGSGTRAAAERLLTRNRPVFVERWRSVLDRRPPESHYQEPSAVIGARDAITCERVLLVAQHIPSCAGDPRERHLHRLVCEAVALWPNARWTLVALDPAAAAPAAAPLQDAGVEVIWGEPDWLSWLHGRGHHYGVVALSAPGVGTGRFDDALRRTQPQAQRVEVLPTGATSPAASAAALVLAAEGEALSAAAARVARVPAAAAASEVWAKALRGAAARLGYL